MTLDAITHYLDNLFPTKELETFKEQRGITYRANKPIKKIGYATNLTPDVISDAVIKGVDLIITHHDAWGFLEGQKEACNALLKANHLSHYFSHLPLDDASFGTNMSLAKALGLRALKQVNEEEGFHCGVVGVYEEPLEFEDFKGRLATILEEPIQAWPFGNQRVKKVHILCGAGHLTSDMATSLTEGCDTYVTGERILYTILNAKHLGLNLLVGSHTFIEKLGVKNMAAKVGALFPELEIVELDEDHLESQPFLG